MLFRVADHAKLYQIDPKLSFTAVNGTDRVVSEEEKLAAETEVTMDETKIVLKQNLNGRYPDVDGMSTDFYKKSHTHIKILPTCSN